MGSVLLCECVIIYFYLLSYVSICSLCFLLLSTPTDKSLHTSLILAFPFNVSPMHQSEGKKSMSVHSVRSLRAQLLGPFPESTMCLPREKEHRRRHLTPLWGGQILPGWGLQGTDALSIMWATVSKHPEASFRLAKLSSPISTGRWWM